MLAKNVEKSRIYNDTHSFSQVSIKKKLCPERKIFLFFSEDICGAHQKSIIDRRVDAVYRDSANTGAAPTLCTLREKLFEQPEKEARDCLF